LGSVFQTAPCRFIPMAMSSDDSFITSNLRDGIHAMQELGWAYPPSTNSGEKERASRGFEQFLKGVTQMSTAAGRLEQDQVEDYVTNLTKDVEEYWPDVLRFLVSMGVQKRARASQIKFVFAKLSKFSPAFAAAVPYAYFGFAPPVCGLGGQHGRTCSEDMFLHCESTLSETSTQYSDDEDNITLDTRWCVSPGCGDEAVVMKNGWRRACLWDRSRIGRKEIAKLDEGTVVTVLDDNHAEYHREYAKVQVVGWVRREYLRK